MTEQVAQPGRADPPRTEMLVPIEVRPALRLRVVEVEHHQPVEPDPIVEIGEERIDRRGLRDVDPGGPRVRRVDAEPDPPRRQASSRGGLGDRRQLGDIDAQPEPAAGRVLEHDHRRVGPVIDLGQRERQAIGQAFRAGRDPGPAVRSDMDVDEPTGEARRRTQVAGEDSHGATEEVLLGPGQVDQVRGVDGDRPDVVLRQAGTERRQLRRGVLATAPRRRVVDEDLERSGADLVGAVDSLDHAVAERKVGAKPSAIGKHPRHRTTRSRPTSPEPLKP